MQISRVYWKSISCYWSASRASVDKLIWHTWPGMNRKNNELTDWGPGMREKVRNSMTVQIPEGVWTYLRAEWDHGIKTIIFQVSAGFFFFHLWRCIAAKIGRDLYHIIRANFLFNIALFNVMTRYVHLIMTYKIISLQRKTVDFITR